MISKNLFSLGLNKFLVYLECVRSYTLFFPLLEPDPSSVDYHDFSCVDTLRSVFALKWSGLKEIYKLFGMEMIKVTSMAKFGYSGSLLLLFFDNFKFLTPFIKVDSGVAGGAGASPEFGGSDKSYS